MKTKIKIRSILYNLLIVMIIVYNFVIWNNSNNIAESNLFYKNNMILIETISYIFRYSIYIYIVFLSSIFIKSFKKFEILMVISLFIFFLFKNNTEIVLQIIMFIGIVIIIKYRTLLNKKMFKKILYIAVIGVLLQYCIFDFRGRRVLSLTDPNFSSYIVFLLVIILNLLKIKVRHLILIIGFTSASRSYLLSILIYFFGDYLVPKRLKKMNYNVLAILIFLFTCLIAVIYLLFWKNIGGYSESYFRILNFIDGSNRIRFESFLGTLKVLGLNIKNFILGLKGNELQTIYHIPNNPHNTILRNFLDNGVIFGTLIYFGINYELFNIVQKQREFSLVLSILVYQAFLPINYANISVLILAIIFILKSKNQLKKGNNK